jgi:hypothetical protein
MGEGGFDVGQGEVIGHDHVGAFVEGLSELVEAVDLDVDLDHMAGLLADAAAGAGRPRTRLCAINPQRPPREEGAQ